MSTITDRLYAHARIVPIQPQNRVKTVRKLDSGALEVTQYSGQGFIIEPTDALFQAFVVYTVLNTNT
ncbi:hypothetical protein DF047_32575 [Burkholderia cenocepacia]|uniref:hypothetical protein n=1 Tax=Burkholderia cepacia complex TaxID=87882 RepID=UPI000F5BF02B|nr:MULTISPECIES: hypothetical protein [Burkholderia cepacia complex]MBO1859266.1 hypothetical protein [Burkholderia cenocepacia]MCW3632831.1 hypothetical protein [Burkholderia cenocepacia]MCW5182388.1 hypothetical protein [Burkholderia cenocepacia]RQV00330.1 hypothetical protein DF047_32575 [Burkholderia cenocepacia]